MAVVAVVRRRAYDDRRVQSIQRSRDRVCQRPLRELEVIACADSGQMIGDYELEPGEPTSLGELGTAARYRDPFGGS